jgi:hypothetical protein
MFLSVAGGVPQIASAERFFYTRDNKMISGEIFCRLISIATCRRMLLAKQRRKVLFGFQHRRQCAVEDSTANDMSCPFPR